MKSLAVTLLLGTMAVSFAASAAGVDSRTYSCAALQSLIAARGFVFISEATFGDFVVADASLCPGGQVVELRTVATRDRAECPVNYCVSREVSGRAGM